MSTIFNFFGLRENPFKINPDPRFLFVTDQTQAASAELVYAIRNRKGLILLTGEVGTGKTMLIRRLLDWLAAQKMPTALIFNSHIRPEHLLDFILNDFGVPCASTLKSEKLMALNRWLLQRYRDGQTPVLMVDEAQGLDTAALEEIRLLLNFETPREKLLQIVLAGQPELLVKLKRHELRQLRQRITVRCTTAPLTLEQTDGYIRERLRIAGADGTPIFEPDAVVAIHAHSRGIPRVINVLAEHSLVNACADGANSVSTGAVEQAARDCQLDRAESVARILNAQSYSAASLSDMGALLATISARTDSAVGPVQDREFAQAPPHARRHVVNPEPSALGTQASSLTEARDKVEQNPTSAEELPTRNVHHAQDSPPRPQTLFVPVETTIAPGLQAESAARSNASLVHFLRFWGNRFAADARATSRHIRSWWNLFISDLRRQSRQLWKRASRLPSDPRWAHIRDRAVSASQGSWTSLKAAMRRWLAKSFGIRHLNADKHTQATLASRAKRRPAILSLRRWLHQPLTTQQKGSARKRGSAG